MAAISRVAVRGEPQGTAPGAHCPAAGPMAAGEPTSAAAAASAAALAAPVPFTPEALHALEALAAQAAF
eukprot:3025266-Alexandrium_andersonii.AAC.1